MDPWQTLSPWPRVEISRKAGPRGKGAPLTFADEACSRVALGELGRPVGSRSLAPKSAPFPHPHRALSKHLFSRHPALGYAESGGTVPL